MFYKTRFEYKDHKQRQNYIKIYTKNWLLSSLRSKLLKEPTRIATPYSNVICWWTTLSDSLDLQFKVVSTMQTSLCFQTSPRFPVPQFRIPLFVLTKSLCMIQYPWSTQSCQEKRLVKTDRVDEHIPKWLVNQIERFSLLKHIIINLNNASIRDYNYVPSG